MMQAAQKQQAEDVCAADKADIREQIYNALEIAVIKLQHKPIM